MRPVLLLALSTLALAACDHSSAGSATPSGSAISPPSATPSASSPAPPASSAASSADPPADATPTEGLGTPPHLPDADLETLEKGLKCSAAAAAKPGPCKVLLAMEHCAEWKAVAPSGDGRWIGHGFEVKGAAMTDVVTLLRSRKVGENEVKNWQLPIKISFSTVPKDAGPAFAQSDRAINAYERHDVPPARNATVDFVKQKTDWTGESPAARTMGEMVETMGDRPAYICQGPGQQIEMVQQASADIGLKSDGLYAELWATSW
jgi:hypothetical protein